MVKRKNEEPTKQEKKTKVEEPESSEEEVVKTNGKKVEKKGKAEPPKKNAPKKKEESEEESEEEEKPKGKKGAAKKAEEPKKGKAKAAPKKKQDSDEEDSDEESEEESKPAKPAKAPAKAPAKKPVKKQDSEDEDEDEDEEEEEKPKKETKKPAKVEQNKKANEKKKPAKKEEEEDEDEDEDEEEEEKPQQKSQKKEEEEEEDGDSGFVVKSAASGGLNIKGKPGAGAPKAGARGGAGKPSGPTNTLFIGNLSFKIEDDDVKNFFSDCGEVVEIRWKTFKDTGKFSGCGFVQFDSVESASKGIQKNGQDLLQRAIRIEFASPPTQSDKKSKGPREKPPGTHTVFVGNCPDSINDDDMYQLFDGIGSITKIRWVTDRNTGQFKGIGFVVFEDTESTDKAVALAGTQVKGKSIRVDFATD